MAGEGVDFSFFVPFYFLGVYQAHYFVRGYFADKHGEQVLACKGIFLSEPGKKLGRKSDANSSFEYRGEMVGKQQKNYIPFC